MARGIEQWRFEWLRCFKMFFFSHMKFVPALKMSSIRRVYILTLAGSPIPIPVQLRTLYRYITFHIQSACCIQSSL